MAAKTLVLKFNQPIIQHQPDPSPDLEALTREKRLCAFV